MFSFLYLFLVFLVFVALCFIMGTWIIHWALFSCQTQQYTN
jgi:hypothetical protein